MPGPNCFGVFIAYLVSMAFAANHKADKPRHIKIQ